MALERNYYKLRLSYTPIGGGEREQKERVILASSSRMALFLLGVRIKSQDGDMFTDNPDRVIHPGADIEIELLTGELTGAQIAQERLKGTPFSEDLIRSAIMAKITEEWVKYLLISKAINETKTKTQKMHYVDAH